MISGKIFLPFYKILPHMLALCLMFSGTCYAKNYADVIVKGYTPFQTHIREAKKNNVAIVTAIIENDYFCVI